MITVFFNWIINPMFLTKGNDLSWEVPILYIKLEYLKM